MFTLRAASRLPSPFSRNSRDQTNPREEDRQEKTGMKQDLIVQNRPSSAKQATGRTAVMLVTNAETER